MNNIILFGGCSGIGKELLKEYSKNEKNKIFVFSKSKKNYEKLHNKYKNNKRIKYYFVNINETTKLKIIMDKEIKSIDKLFISVGSYNKKDIFDINIKEIDKEINNNALSIIKLIKLSSKYFNKGSSILIVSSICSLKKCDNVLYSISKSLIDNFIKQVSFKLIDKKIRINGINPTIIKSNFHLDNKLVKNEKEYNQLLKSMPVNEINNKIFKPKNILSTIKFLLSKKSKFLTGLNIPIGEIII